MRQPTILLFDPESTGHHVSFLRYFVNAITTNIPAARIIVLTSANVAAHPDYIDQSDNISDCVTTELAPEIVEVPSYMRRANSFYQSQWKHSEMLARGIDAIGAGQIDFVLLPYLETVGLMLLVLRPRQFRGRAWAALAMGMRFHFRESGVDAPARWQDHIQRYLVKLLLARQKLVCLASVEPYLARTMRNPKVVYTAEPTAPRFADRDAARRAYGIRAETCLILIFGFIGPAKCIDLLLEAVARLDADLDVTVLLVGVQHTDYMVPILASEVACDLLQRGRLVIVNRYIMDDVDLDPMNAADISWVFYSRHFVWSSNALARASRFNLPVICRKQGVIGRLVADTECGLALASDAPADVADALERLARSPALRAEMGRRGAAAFANATVEAFATPIIDKIKLALAAD